MLTPWWHDPPTTPSELVPISPDCSPTRVPGDVDPDFLAARFGRSCGEFVQQILYAIGELGQPCFIQLSDKPALLDLGDADVGHLAEVRAEHGLADLLLVAGL